MGQDIRRGFTPPNAHLGLLLVHLAAGVAEVPREAKVGDLADFIVIHEDVAGGEVAVDYLE